jgi:hypothetical protein
VTPRPSLTAAGAAVAELEARQALEAELGQPLTDELVAELHELHAELERAGGVPLAEALAAHAGASYAELEREAALTCDAEGCAKPGPYPDERALEAHRASHRRVPCQYCGDPKAPQGLAHHERSCAKRTAAERTAALEGRRHRPHTDAELAPTLAHLPTWLEGLTADAELAGRLLEFVASANTAGNLTAGMAIVAGPSWGPHLVKVSSLPAVAVGQGDAGVIVLDAARLAHDLALELELAEGPR